MRKKSIKILLILIVVICLLVPQLVFAQNEAASPSDDYSLDYLRSIMNMIKDKYKGEITDKQLIEGALKGMFNTMDSYTVYFSLQEANSFLSDIQGTYEGIGVMISKVGDYIVVTKVFASSPAEKAGIYQGDKIATVDGKNIIGVSPDEAASLIKGESGTKVTLGIIKNGETDITTIEVYRGQIKVNPVTYEIRDDIGYIKLDIFNLNSDEFITQSLNEMDKKNIKKIILDLRNNPGGDVEQVVMIAKKFVPEGLITKLDFKSESTSDTEYYSDLKSIKYKLVVLVNKMSASASEILAGAIQDTGAGVLVGTKTFGKAKVQNLIPLLTPEAYKKYENQLGVKFVDAYELITKYGVTPSDDEIMGWSKITTGEYTTPKGRMIDNEGLTPDIYVDDPVLVNEIDINNIQKLTKTSKPSLNSEGVDVYNAEKILKVSGYDVDLPDNRLDCKTFNAIAKFQQDSGLFPYGVLDFTTQEALNNKLNGLIPGIDKQYAKAVEVLKDSNNLLLKDSDIEAK